jgi:hypothetical protein
MASFNPTLHGEGLSISRPPFFNGSDYSYWKTRMSIFLQSIDYDLWNIVSEGPFVPTKIVNGESKPKEPREYNDDDRKKMSLNAKAINMLYCALDRNEFNRISTLSSAQEIWHTLEVTHEGTSQVKESKISMLVHSYELFKMKSDESISEMFTRFTDIINSLKSLGKSYSNVEMVRKILRCLPKSWEPKVTAIQEAKDLTKLPLEELMGSLMTHEIILKENEEESKKKKNIAFKSSTKEEGDDSDDEGDDEDLAFITRKLKRMIRRNQGFKRNSRKEYKGQSSKQEKKKDQIICYECKRPGHVKMDCPSFKNQEKKSKAMKATNWDDSEVSSSEEEDCEVANMCFMALGENEVSILNHDSNLSYDELLEAFQNLHIVVDKQKLKINAFKKKSNFMLTQLEELMEVNESLENENDLLKQKDFESLENQICSLKIENEILKQKNFDKLEKENDMLKKENNDLRKIVDSFTKSTKNLNSMLQNQRCVFDKRGLGYKTYKNQKYFKNYFVHASSRYNSNHSCTYCGRKGHQVHSCYIKKSPNLKQIWVPKGTITNPQGPNYIWVPKSHYLNVDYRNKGVANTSGT